MNSVPPQVLLVLTVWLETADLAREDLREQPGRLVTPVRRVLQVSQAFVRRQCVWLLQRTPLQDYRRQEQSKDPMFRELSLHQQLTTPGREERRRETTVFSEYQGWGTILVTGCITPLLKQRGFDEWDIVLILIPHITMTAAAHIHPHPSEFSSVFG